MFFANWRDRYLRRLCNGKILNDQAGLILTTDKQYAIVIADWHLYDPIALDNGLEPSASISPTTSACLFVYLCVFHDATILPL
jgi:hypothetical protein